ncbi:MAG TPA: NAD(P)/FAD-dependent oxidoreductase [Sulfurimonas sp.]|nr:NAD(P)/FAD-dependent oxidoreductase [Sulfurimonas sp.]
MTRREIIKLLMAYGLASLVDLQASELKGKKIVIVGAGTGGLICVALFKQLSPHLELVVIAPNDKHIYQAGQTFIAAGLMKEEEIVFPTKVFLKDTKWIKESVKSFEPDSNYVLCEDNQKVFYDYLIVAMGLEYNYEKIKGLKKEDIGSNGITSVFLNDLKEGSFKGATYTAAWFESIREKAEKQKVKVLFTHPYGAIKCGGASTSIMSLLVDYLKGNSPKGGKDLSTNVELIFAKPGTKIFGVGKYNEVLMENASFLGIKIKFNHVLHEVDIKNKLAFFEHKYKVKGMYDEDFDEWEIISKQKEVSLSYDFIHITPPMQAVSVLSKSKLAKKQGLQVGYCEVDRSSLQHIRYENVFSVGDSAAVPLGKTSAAAASHAKIAVQNILNIIKKEKFINFDGYSSCPIKLSYKKVLFTEFNYEGYTEYKIKNPKQARMSLFRYDLEDLPKLYWKSIGI